MTGAAERKYSMNAVYASFFQRCEAAMARQAGEWCCLAVDIQHFKLYNNICGRERGDQLLSRYMEILKEQERQLNGAAAYFGQDDFALFMPYDLGSIEQLYASLYAVETMLENNSGFLPAIGVFRMVAGDDLDLEMYDKAYVAAQEAKRHRSRRIYEYDAEAYEREKEEFALMLRLGEAMEQGRITFYLQPQCRITTRKIVGAEALARWIDTDGKMISPGVFIPVLERNGMIADFDRVIWRKVVSWLRSILDRGITPVPVSINVSQKDIHNMNVAWVLRGLCEEFNVPTGLLKVEITETSYSREFELMQSLIKELRGMGFLTMMDDFGSGYSSLSMLENVNVDVLKLDMAFVKEANIHSRKGVTIVESIVNMSKMMDLPIVVEGIETEDQAIFLRNMGCRYAQGYYFYRPIPSENFEQLIASEERLDRQGFQSKKNEQFHVREFMDDNTFTDSMLNNVLGPVAFYSLDGKELSIIRFNEQFYRTIADSEMESRQGGIQNYVVEQDRPLLYQALEKADANVGNGGSCEVRFYKSNNSVFWFRIHFYFLHTEGDKRIYYGQIQDVDEQRQQSMQFFGVLCEQSDVTMMMNLDKGTIQYVADMNSFFRMNQPSMSLDASMEKTMETRMDHAEDREKFRKFFNVERMRDSYKKGIYYERATLNFRLRKEVVPVEFSIYLLRHSKDQDLLAYTFVKRIEKE